MIAFVVAIADLYFVVRFLLETEGLIKRPKLEPESEAKGSARTSKEAEKIEKPKTD